jgi:hypothetical protein
MLSTSWRDTVNHTPSKPWYKHWWGVILAILIWPIFLTWLVWAKTHWHTVGKIAATAGVIFLILWFYSELELLQILHTINHNSRNLTIQSSAYKLAAYDLGHAPDASTVAQYQIALDGLKPFCMESEEKLAGEVWTSEKGLRKNGIIHETNLTLLGHTRSSFGSNSPHKVTNCLGVLSAYLAVREPPIHQ